MKIIDEAKAQESRNEYGDQLIALGQQIKDGKAIPTACFYQVYWSDGEVARGATQEMGFNLLIALGVFDVIKAEIMDEIRGNNGT